MSGSPAGTVAMQPLPPNIGRYVVEELVGVGGMGQIYRAQDPVLRRTVAIKLISTKLMSGADRADYIKRFRREAEAAARCAHPNIVAVYDFALHEEQPYLAMEFVAGRSLRQLLDDAPVMDIPDAIAIMLQVLDALTSAHEQGVIHQDIKPGNIMLTTDQRVKVGDFGISKLMNVETTTIFSTIGTPSYMSPEQCRGDDVVDGRSDIFSAGAMLFEMVAGERAFQGRNVTEVSHRIQNDTLPLLPAHVRNAAPRLQLVLERAMGKHPADRFDTGSRHGRGPAPGAAGGGARQHAHRARGQGRDGGHAARAARGLRRAQAAPAARSHAAEDGGGKAPDLCRSGRARPGADSRRARPFRRRPCCGGRAVGARRGRSRAVPARDSVAGADPSARAADGRPTAQRQQRPPRQSSACPSRSSSGRRRH